MLLLLCLFKTVPAQDQNRINQAPLLGREEDWEPWKGCQLLLPWAPSLLAHSVLFWQGSTEFTRVLKAHYPLPSSPASLKRKGHSSSFNTSCLSQLANTHFASQPWLRCPMQFTSALRPRSQHWAWVLLKMVVGWQATYNSPFTCLRLWFRS